MLKECICHVDRFIFTERLLRDAEADFTENNAAALNQPIRHEKRMNKCTSGMISYGKRVFNTGMYYILTINISTGNFNDPSVCKYYILLRE